MNVEVGRKGWEWGVCIVGEWKEGRKGYWGHWG